MHSTVHSIRASRLGPNPWAELFHKVRIAIGFGLLASCAIGSALYLGAKLPPGIHIIAVVAAVTGGAVFTFKR
jgi:hypothetical protein